MGKKNKYKQNKETEKSGSESQQQQQQSSQQQQQSSSQQQAQRQDGQNQPPPGSGDSSEQKLHKLQQQLTGSGQQQHCDQQQKSQKQQQRGVKPSGQEQQQGAWAQPQQRSGQHKKQQNPQQTSLQQQQPTQQRPFVALKQQSVSLSAQSIHSIPTSPGSSTSASSIQRGTIGKPGLVETNYLLLDMKNMPNIAYHYDVTITPNIPKKFLRPAFEQFNEQFFPEIFMAYDGQKSFYTAKLLPIDKEYTDKVVISENNGKRNMSFEIVIKATDDMEINLGSLRNYMNDRIFDKPMRALQCLDVVLANPCHKQGVRVGQSFYNPSKPLRDLGDGFELWLGLYQAMVLGEEPLLNVDIAHKSFPKEMTIIEYLNQLGREPFNPRNPLKYQIKNKLISFIKGLRIIYQPPPIFGEFAKEFTVNNVSEESASERMFTLDDGSKLSVAQHYQRRGCNLKYPELNCLIVGSSVKMISLPIEFCKIKSGQAIRKKDGDRQIREMITYAATPTYERKEKIMNLLKRFNHNISDVIKSFGINILPNFINVPIRVLNAPNIEYFGMKTIQVSNGSWRMENNHFLITKDKQHKWAIIYSMGSSIRNIRTLMGHLQNGAKSINLNLDPKPLIDTYKKIDDKLRDLEKEKYDLVIVVIPCFGTSYGMIKQAAELKYGILTQCIKENTVERRCNMQLAMNLLLKINAKLNGTNHKIAATSHVTLRNVMFLGADVTHPSPDQKNIPSVVGVAASHDANGACYNMQYRLQGLQKSSTEIIQDMKSIFKYHLNVYKSKQNHFPDHVIYYRDGVSDGEFLKVKNEELHSMRAACKDLGAEIKITCIIAVKRHHTRFFPKNQNPKDKFNNVVPGTVVDQRIVHPNEKQFFMVSHQAIQGTARPTRYNVIEDDDQMDINDLQILTHNLCHLFPRCNRAVSYATPVYLAHLVAARGRVYLEGIQQFGDVKKEYKNRLVQDKIMNSNPMFFV